MLSALPSRLEQERDLYLALLTLSGEENPEEFAKRALRLAVQVFDAQKGYLEISDSSDTPKGSNTWWTSVGCGDDDLARYRHGISSGILADTFARGKAVRVMSALIDPNWRDNKSVRLNNIGPVLCSPIGVPPLGVIYLQGRTAGHPFQDTDEELLALLARHLLPLCQRLFHRNAVAGRDPTSELRQRLKVEGLVGASVAMARVLHNVELYAPLDMTLLVTGESGTGKTQIARAVHDNSPRRDGPFVEVNMAAIDGSLFTSEVFGHEKGAFTSADKMNPGKIATAEGGTLFMDEVGELSLEAQTKLLQFLQSKTYQRVGSSTPLRADVRVIAATNANLRQRVAERTFRPELLSRLDQVSLRVPCLRERRDDIPDLASYFCTKTIEENRLGHEVQLSYGALAELRLRDWRDGNIRELQNVVQKATIRACSVRAAEIEPQFLDDDAYSSPDSESRTSGFHEQTRRFQKSLLESALRRTGWNVSETAQVLDLARAHVYNLINRFGLERDRGE